MNENFKNVLKIPFENKTIKNSNNSVKITKNETEKILRILYSFLEYIKNSVIYYLFLESKNLHRNLIIRSISLF